MIRRLVWLSILLLPLCANALGVRGITVNSFLNEPLDASIELVAFDSADIGDIKVSLADADAFKKAGLRRNFQLSSLRFRAKLNGQGVPFIHVTSSKSIREPYLDFLITVSWDGNTLQRQYTLLLDPRTYRAVAANPQKSPAPPPEPASIANAATPAAASTYGPVRRSETLWVIADKVRPSAAVSVEQMMMALQRQNPEAFGDGNVNLLKAGVTLEIPGQALVEQMTRREARAAFRQQIKAWKARRNGAAGGSPVAAADAAPPVVRQQPPTEQPVPAVVDQKPPSSSGQTAAETAAVADGEASLRVVEAGREWLPGSDKTDQASYPVDQSEQIREAVTDVKNDLAAVQEINRNLAELRGAMEEQISALRKQLDERDALIQRLQKQLEETAQVAATAVATAKQKAVAAEEQKVAIAAEQKKEQAAVQQPARTAAEGTITTPLAPPAQPVQQRNRVEPKPLTDQLAWWAGEYWLPLLVVGLLLLIMLLMSIGRRRKAESGLPEADAFSSYEELEPDQHSRTPLETLPRSGADSAEPPTLKAYDEQEGAFIESAADAASLLTEADIYLAYRRYSQAESLVQEAIKLHPDNMVLQAKLLEIYAFRKDKRRFTQGIETIHMVMSAEAPEIWAKVVEMGRQLIPQHYLVAEEIVPDDTQSGVKTSDLPFSLDDDHASIADLADDDLPHETIELLDLDFELDEESDQEKGR